MTLQEFAERLADVAEAGDGVVGESYRLIDEVEQGEVSVDLVEPILRCMEAHPHADFGSPGPLVHFVEGFSDNGYESLLLASIERRPTPHTVWMLNRWVNGEKDKELQKALVELLRGISQDSNSDDGTREIAASFLEHAETLLQSE